jgi:hypothetical protein
MSDVFRHMDKRNKVCTDELKNECLNFLMCVYAWMHSMDKIFIRMFKIRRHSGIKFDIEWSTVNNVSHVLFSLGLL